MKNNVFGLLSFLSVFFPLALQAQPAAELLQQKLASVKTFSAGFQQQVWDAQQQLIQQGEGKLILKQPSLFYFETVEPEPNLFISNGKTLWHYNELLEQVSIYDAADQVSSTPFALLTSVEPALWQQYEITQQQNRFIITSKDTNNPVQQLSLLFADEILSGMQVTDINLQQTEFEFQTIQLNTPVADEIFHFDIPADTDVDDQRQQVSP